MVLFKLDRQWRYPLKNFSEATEFTILNKSSHPLEVEVYSTRWKLSDDETRILYIEIFDSSEQKVNNDE